MTWGYKAVNPAVNTESVPFFEDANSGNSSGHSTSKTPEKLQAEVIGLMSQLGGAAVRCEEVAWESKPKRYGYLVRFVLINADDSSVKCRIPLAALPLRQETPVKRRQVLAQVLYAFRETLQGEINALRYRPGYAPFAAHIIEPESGKTLMEVIAERANLTSGAPLLPTGEQS